MHPLVIVVAETDSAWNGSSRAMTGSGRDGFSTTGGGGDGADCTAFIATFAYSSRDADGTLVFTT